MEGRRRNMKWILRVKGVGEVNSKESIG